MCRTELSPAETAAIAAIVAGRPGVGLILDEHKKRKRRVRQASRYQQRLSNAGAAGIKKARNRVKPPRHAVMEVPALIDLGHSEATLDGLITAGWLADWNVPKRPRRVTLTCWGAERYHTILAETEAEVPYWERDPKPEPGDPAPKPPPIVMPTGYKTRRLPDWVLQLFPDQGPGPVEEVEAAEEYVMQAAVTSNGDVVRDEKTGLPGIVELLLMASRAADDGLRGGLGTPSTGKIPRIKPRRKRVPKRKRK